MKATTSTWSRCHPYIYTQHIFWLSSECLYSVWHTAYHKCRHEAAKASERQDERAYLSRCWAVIGALRESISQSVSLVLVTSIKLLCDGECLKLSTVPLLPLRLFRSVSGSERVILLLAPGWEPDSSLWPSTSFAKMWRYFSALEKCLTRFLKQINYTVL